MFWYMMDIPRLDLERAEIEKLATESKWLQEAKWLLDKGELCLDADIESKGRIYPVRMRYSAVFPACPPSVYPINAKERWSSHQYGTGGELCLEWGPDTWTPGVTGAQVLCSAFKLIGLESGSEEATDIIVPSRHFLSVGQKLRSTFFRFFYDDSLLNFLTSLPEKTTAICDFIGIFNQENLTILADIVKVDDQNKWVNDSIPDGLKQKQHRKGVCFKTTVDAEWLEKPKLSELKTFLESDGFDISLLTKKSESLESDVDYILILDEKNKLNLFWIADAEKNKCYNCSVTYFKSNDDGGRTSPDFSILKDKKIGIVGLGSVGGKISISLGRTGVRDYLLIDDDIFMPENICRNELTWYSLGQHKVDAVKDRLLLLSPGIKVTVRRLKLSGQEASASVASALQQLSECDLIIDATAEPTTFNQLAAVSIQFKIPFIWLEIFAGGIGGLIARCQPSHHQNPYHMRQTFAQITEEKNLAEIKSIGNYSAEKNDGEIVIATDADVSAIAYNAVRLAIDTLIDREPSMFPHSMYLIGLDRGWIFEEPFHTIPVEIKPIEQGSESHTLTEQRKEQNLKFLLDLLENMKSESSSSTRDS